MNGIGTGKTTRINLVNVCGSSPATLLTKIHREDDSKQASDKPLPMTNIEFNNGMGGIRCPMAVCSLPINNNKPGVNFCSMRRMFNAFPPLDNEIH